MAEMTLSKARELCTPAELRLVEASSRRAVATLDAGQLKKYVAQARKLRDKWRDQAERQQRRVQQAKGGRTAAGSARSRQKARLFGEVLSRFEAQLDKTAAASDAGKARGKAATRRPSKRQRAEGHRLTRSQTRQELEEKRAGLETTDSARRKASASAGRKASASAGRKASASAGRKASAAGTGATAAAPATGPEAALDQPPRAQPAPSPPAASAAATTQDTAAQPQAAMSAKASKPKRSSKGGPPAKSKFDKKDPRQQSARSAAKRARIKTSGLNTRIRGHVSARGKRAQSRRDARR